MDGDMFRPTNGSGKVVPSVPSMSAPIDMFSGVCGGVPLTPWLLVMIPWYRYTGCGTGIGVVYGNE